MSLLEETRRLLRTYHIVPKKPLGQNFLVDGAIFPKLVEYASLNRTDVVLDVGAGLGFLTRYMAAKCARAVAVERDSLVASVLREQVKDERNISLIEGDVLNTALPFFDKVVSAPPYQISSALFKWLFSHPLKIAVLILQEEFANRITARVGTEDYSWITVYAYYHAEVELLDALPRQKFYPEPEVDSIIVRLIPRPRQFFLMNDPALFSQMLKSVFAERNKKLINAALPFARDVLRLSSEDAKLRLGKLQFCEERVRALMPEAFGEVARVLIG